MVGMLESFFGLKRDRDLGRRESRVPEGKRVYAIGDIHGRADLLRKIHALILEDVQEREPAENIAIYLGDYVDRGHDSRGVLDILIDQPLPGFQSIHLMGNHEDFMVRFLEDPKVGPPWIVNGGNATLLSYGVSLQKVYNEEALKEGRNQLMARLPPPHWAFLHDLKTHHIEGDFLFVHAGVRPGIRTDEQEPQDMMWIRDDFLNSVAEHDHVVVHGHSINPKAEILDNRIGIDTGAYETGKLTCLVLDGGKKDLLNT
jgi:serine/threonine protein phosphatase 1